MKSNIFIEKIETTFPALTWKHVEVVDHGYDHTVVILDKKIVFRFPKSAEYEKLLESEITLMHVIHRYVNTAVPVYTYIPDDVSFGGYPYLSGKEITVSRYHHFSLEDKKVLAQKIASFISELHTIPLHMLKGISLEKEDPLSLHTSLVRDIQTSVYPKLKKQDIVKIEGYFDEMHHALQSPYTPTLVHRDLSSGHILWNKTTQNVSIIDFSDRAIGDPAIDIAGLFAYGPKFVSHVMSQYTGPTDANFLTRAKLYRKRVGLYLMKDSVKGTVIPFKKAYEEFRKRFY